MIRRHSYQSAQSGPEPLRANAYGASKGLLPVTGSDPVMLTVTVSGSDPVMCGYVPQQTPAASSFDRKRARDLDIPRTVTNNSS